MKKIYAVLALLVIFPNIASAKIFANQFIEFELPEKWDCQLDGTEWVCQSNDEEKKRDAIIVLAAKIKKAGMDELPVYKAHLEKPQIYKSLSGEEITSEARYVKDLEIKGKPWIDSLHLQSEIPDFYTRYLATVEADLGILVTFSVRKDKYEEYAPDIEKMVGSLRAFRKEGDINTTGAQPALDPEVLNAPEGGSAGARKRKAGGEEAAGAGLLVVLLLAGGGYWYWKKKMKK